MSGTTSSGSSSSSSSSNSGNTDPNLGLPDEPKTDPDVKAEDQEDNGSGSQEDPETEKPRGQEDDDPGDQGNGAPAIPVINPLDVIHGAPVAGPSGMMTRGRARTLAGEMQEVIDNEYLDAIDAPLSTKVRLRKYHKAQEEGLDMHLATIAHEDRIKRLETLMSSENPMVRYRARIELQQALDQIDEDLKHAKDLVRGSDSDSDHDSDAGTVQDLEEQPDNVAAEADNTILPERDLANLSDENPLIYEGQDFTINISDNEMLAEDETLVPEADDQGSRTSSLGNEGSSHPELEWDDEMRALIEPVAGPSHSIRIRAPNIEIDVSSDNPRGACSSTPSTRDRTRRNITEWFSTSSSHFGAQRDQASRGQTRSSRQGHQPEPTIPVGTPRTTRSGRTSRPPTRYDDFVQFSDRGKSSNAEKSKKSSTKSKTGSDQRPDDEEEGSSPDKSSSPGSRKSK